MPTLVIRGDSDKLGSLEDNQRLVDELSSNVKRYVEIEQAGHMIQYETNNTKFYQAIVEFLERSNSDYVSMSQWCQSRNPALPIFLTTHKLTTVP